MSAPQIVFAVLLIALLTALAGYYAWRQVGTLRALRSAGDLPPEDLRYFRRQAWLRLVSAGLMALFAALLVGSFVLEPAAQALIDRGDAAQSGDETPLQESDKPLARFYGFYWIGALLVLLALVTTALYDLLAIRRFGQRHFRQLQADRRAMIERQVSQLRQQRNGHADR